MSKSSPIKSLHYALSVDRGQRRHGEEGSYALSTTPTTCLQTYACNKFWIRIKGKQKKLSLPPKKVLLNPLEKKGFLAFYRISTWKSFVMFSSKRGGKREKKGVARMLHIHTCTEKKKIPSLSPGNFSISIIKIRCWLSIQMQWSFSLTLCLHLKRQLSSSSREVGVESGGKDCRVIIFLNEALKEKKNRRFYTLLGLETPRMLVVWRSTSLFSLSLPALGFHGPENRRRKKPDNTNSRSEVFFFIFSDPFFLFYIFSSHFFYLFFWVGGWKGVGCRFLDRTSPIGIAFRTQRRRFPWWWEERSENGVCSHHHHHLHLRRCPRRLRRRSRVLRDGNEEMGLDENLTFPSPRFSRLEVRDINSEFECSAHTQPGTEVTHLYRKGLAFIRVSLSLSLN